MAAGGGSPPSFDQVDPDCSADMGLPSFNEDIREMLLHTLQAACKAVDLTPESKLTLNNMPTYSRALDITTAFAASPDKACENTLVKNADLITKTIWAYQTHKDNPETMQCAVKSVVDEHIINNLCEHKWEAFVALVFMAYKYGRMVNDDSRPDVPCQCLRARLLAFLTAVLDALNENTDLVKAALGSLDVYESNYACMLDEGEALDFGTFDIDQAGPSHVLDMD